MKKRCPKATVSSGTPFICSNRAIFILVFHGKNTTPIKSKAFCALFAAGTPTHAFQEGATSQEMRINSNTTSWISKKDLSTSSTRAFLLHTSLSVVSWAVNTSAFQGSCFCLHSTACSGKFCTKKLLVSAKAWEGLASCLHNLFPLALLSYHQRDIPSIRLGMEFRGGLPLANNPSQRLGIL